MSGLRGNLDDAERAHDSEMPTVSGLRALPERLYDGRLRYEVPTDGFEPSLQVRWRPELRVTIELSQTLPIEVIGGEVLPELQADFLLVQPDIAARDGRRGWAAVGCAWDRELHFGQDSRLEVAPLQGIAHLFTFQRSLYLSQARGVDLGFAVVIDGARP